ncbi:helix-turn-helix domain-containing protein [Chitinophaga qingshengii]|uniref:Helix-turn-helix domain-containing protein n=1 Tax=Chitinophaga qingshengii TaxID=1569794 RepID=A0ABR7TF14_9BACT|nr:helix-turn-helix domain-containing protein [Chitinophaga qingshengii]MBC9928892.1 helix-turn-helix domain-containing protein [Chitinophaga qingshengii]
MKPAEQTYHDYRLPVPPEFETVFSHFYFAANNSASPVSKTLLPSFQTIMVFNFGAKARLISRQKTEIEVDKCIVLGPIKSVFDYVLPSGAQILVANFKDDAFYRFFGKASLSDHLPIHPDEAMEENCFTYLWHQLNGITGVPDKIDRILDFCRPYLKLQDSTAAMLANFKDDTLNPIKSVAEETGQTERNLQLIHKKYFGYSAKEISRYQRFIKAIGLIQQTLLSINKVDWFDIIAECGYYDQSQLIHDFKHFIHLSPKNFVKFQQDICQPSAE